MSNNRLTHEEFIKLLTKYDFKTYSMSSFSKKYGVCVKTVKKYIKKLNLPHNTVKRNISYKINPLNGQFISYSYESKPETRLKKIDERFEKKIIPNLNNPKQPVNKNTSNKNVSNDVYKKEIFVFKENEDIKDFCKRICNIVDFKD